MIPQPDHQAARRAEPGRHRKLVCASCGRVGWRRRWLRAYMQRWCSQGCRPGPVTVIKGG